MAAPPPDPGSSRSWWDELDTGDGPASLRVRPVGDRVRLVVEVGADGVDVHLPAATAAELGRALVAAADVDAGAGVGDGGDGAASPGGPVGDPSPPLPWSGSPPTAADRDTALVAALDELRRLCSVLPETVEVDTLGDPSFRVATRMFAVVETVEEVPVVRFKTTSSHQAELVGDERFRADPETGHRGWTALRLDELAGTHELEAVVLTSYRVVAPPDLVAQLDAVLDAARPPGEG